LDLGEERCKNVACVELSQACLNLFSHDETPLGMIELT
jgi:hypothetical protein